MALPYPIEGPPAVAPAVGLLRPALVRDGGGRWEGGFTFDPRSCTSGMGGFRFCTPAELAYVARPDWTDGIPFSLSHGETCGSFGWEAADYRTRVRELFEAHEAKEIEHELWTGTLEPNGLHLASGGDVEDLSASTLAAPVEALAALEGFLADNGSGGRGMIHMTRRALTMLASLGLFYRDGGNIFTWAGTLVVPGAGYPGTGPAGEANAGSEWMFATGWVLVLRGDLQSLPPNLSEALNRSTNEVSWAATRSIGLAFDPCLLGAAEFSMPLAAGTTVLTASVNADDDGDNVVILSVPGRRIVIVGWELTSTTAAVVTVKDSAAAVLGTYAGGSDSYAAGAGEPALQTGVGEGLIVANAAGQDTVGTIRYRTVLP